MSVFAFYLFAISVIAGGLFTVISRNPVHSVLWLILSFLSAAGLFVLLNAEFVAMLLIIVYVGAVAVLFLFVVMMLDINVDVLRQGFWSHFPVAATVGVIIALEMAVVLLRGFNLPIAKAMPGAAEGVPNTKLLGIELYTDYLYPLEIAAVILLVAIIAAIALTLRRRKDVKGQNPAEQVKAKKADRLRIVKMDPVRAVPSAPAAADATAPKGQA